MYFSGAFSFHFMTGVRGSFIVAPKSGTLELGGQDGKICPPSVCRTIWYLEYHKIVKISLVLLFAHPNFNCFLRPCKCNVFVGPAKRLCLGLFYTSLRCLEHTVYIFSPSSPELMKTFQREDICIVLSKSKHSELKVSKTWNNWITFYDFRPKYKPVIL